ncbi:MAG: hypothetical protein LR015_02205 [Verrucomicrobia bacterium]|nr:hypothetical protein [Verrucomicrobiota bacterium]
MPVTSKTSGKSSRKNRVKVTAHRVGHVTSEEQRIEEFLLSEGFKPMTTAEKGRLKRAGVFGMPNE